MAVSFNYARQIENSENLRNIARRILANSGASSEATHKIIEQTIFDTARVAKELYSNAQLSTLKASTQITLNNTLKETLRYIKNNSYKKNKKEIVFGELWEIFSANNQTSEENPEHNELYEFQINHNAKNIFAS